MLLGIHKAFELGLFVCLHIYVIIFFTRYFVPSTARSFREILQVVCHCCGPSGVSCLQNEHYKVNIPAMVLFSLHTGKYR